MPIEKKLSYEIGFDFTKAEKQAEDFAKKHNAKLQKISQAGAGVTGMGTGGVPFARGNTPFFRVVGNKVVLSPPGQTRNPQQPQQQIGVLRTILYFLHRFTGTNSPINQALRIGTHIGLVPRNFITNPFGAGGVGGGGKGGGILPAGAGGAGGFGNFLRGGAGSLLLRGGLIGLAVAGVVIALKEIKDQFTNFAKGVGLITKSIVTGNTVSALHGLGHIGQAGASVAGMAIGGVLSGGGGFLLGGYLGNKLGGLVHSLIDGLEGIVDALGKYSPIVNAQLAQFKVKQFMFSYQMAQVFQPLMSAWIKLKSFILDVLGAFGQVIRPLVQMAGNALNNFVDYLKLATIGIVNYLSNFLQNISPIIAALAPDMMGALNTVVNGLNKTAGILGRANNSLDDAASKFVQSFINSFLNYKNTVNPKAWLPMNHHLGNALPGQPTVIAPTAAQRQVANQNQANNQTNKDPLADFVSIHEKEYPNLNKGNSSAPPLAPHATVPPYVPGPTLQWQNSISNQFNLKVSMDEMVEKSIAEIRRELSHYHEESAAETTLASLLVTGAVKGLLV